MPEPAAAERAYALTKERVLSGELAAGRLLSEGEVAEQLGMSRTPVREAFLRLEAEELLSLIPKRGAVVVPVPPGEADDVLDAREAIETAAVRRLVRTPAAVPAAVAELRAALDEQREHALPDDMDAFARADEAFHRAIVAAGGNALTGRFYRTLADRQRRMTVRAIDGDPRFIAQVLDEHAELVTIVESGDVAAFETALRAHLDGTHRR
ncbi:GntR family transcriptional regulator [Pseudonocardia endophytica]|uniref:GntR family transcriptional regulator n=1 Tax=Pseudonocardia endophytica TaxID=401976 RepID=A0A4R1HUX8_PSEEN|nr:GntR family transcriptional regulator [Pseudonocardia endophytica]TCK26068.1 GntR family transcriptional regulator [Pseudonocardia endophytica]